MRKSLKWISQDENRIIQSSRYLWIVHFLIGFLVLTIGMYRNGGRKYIKAKPDMFQTDQNCKRVYVDVISRTGNNADDIICCDESNSDPSTSWSTLFSSYDHGLCSEKLKSLPFAKSFTRFPQAWVSPVIPLLLRIGISGLASIVNIFLHPTPTIPHESKISTSMKRLLFYFMIMQIRGWILYIFMNEVVMKKMILSFFPISAMGTINTVQQQNQDRLDACWYSNLIHNSLNDNDGDECYGQRFDFSDHIVLFYGHYYPIMIFEVIFCITHPFWLSSTHDDGKDKPNASAKASTKSIWIFSLANIILPITVLFIFGYLSFIVLASVYSTSTYFHTVPESIIGYLLSLLVQIPLGIVLFHQEMIRIRDFLGFAKSSRSHGD